MGWSWAMLRLLCLYLVLNTQYSFYGASPLFGDQVRMAYLEELPFIVSISRKTCGSDESLEIASHLCGGSLITTRHVLTAAHCFRDERRNNIIVKVGSIDLVNDRIFGIIWWKTYCQWAGIHLANYIGDYVYDMAIIKLRGKVLDIELPTISYTPDADLYGKSVETGGWGRVEGDRKPRYMRIANFAVRSPERCEPFLAQKDFFLKNLLPKLNLCTAPALAATTACGDSGSPLLRGNNIVGVNTASCKRGIDAKLSDHRNLHSSVNAYAEFIEAVKRM